MLATTTIGASMADVFLWLALHLCGSAYDGLERSVVKDMPSTQLAEQYVYLKPADETSCHWLRWKQTIADEMARRLR
jgi:hypothetical protein